MTEKIIKKKINGETVFFKKDDFLLQWYFEHEGLMHGDTLVLSPAVVERWEELKDRIISKQELKIRARIREVKEAKVEGTKEKKT